MSEQRAFHIPKIGFDDEATPLREGHKRRSARHAESGGEEGKSCCQTGLGTICRMGHADPGKLRMTICHEVHPRFEPLSRFRATRRRSRRALLARPVVISEFFA
jgi:hypothetical protein